MFSIESLSIFVSPPFIFLSAAAVLNGALLVRTIYIIAATPVLLPTNPLPTTIPKISILLPVRNEASRILRENVQSLLLQSYPQLEIVAVDDKSTDQTPQILREYEASTNTRLSLIQGIEPPRGWMGKTFALHQAKVASAGEWLLACDADVIYSEEAISSSLAFALKHRLDALSLLPRVIMLTFWEAVIIPAMCWLSLMRVSTTQTNRESSRACFGYGNFILFRRKAHDAIGSFEAYRNDILDDCAIMELLKSRGFRIMVADGSSIMRSRMYSSLSQMFMGFGKNSFAALRFSILRTTAVVLGEVIFVFFPHVYILYVVATCATLSSSVYVAFVA